MPTFARRLNNVETGKLINEEALSTFDRLGCLSLRIALASICRIRVAVHAEVKAHAHDALLARRQ
jgi:hypothetical protein